MKRVIYCSAEQKANVKMVIGAGGQYVRKLADEHGCEIYVFDGVITIKGEGEGFFETLKRIYFALGLKDQKPYNDNPKHSIVSENGTLLIAASTEKELMDTWRRVDTGKLVARFGKAGTYSQYQGLRLPPYEKYEFESGVAIHVAILPFIRKEVAK